MMTDTSVQAVGADGADYGTFESEQAARDALPFTDWCQDDDGPVYTDDPSAGQRISLVAPA